MMIPAWLGLGSNLGDPVANLAEAVRRLPGVRMVSSVYRSGAILKEDQPDFYNTVAFVECSCSPVLLLRQCLEIESAMGRVRRERWGPRVIDIDILLFGDFEVDQDDLRIPHTGLLERSFAAVPVLEISPDVTLPGGALLKNCVRTQELLPRLEKVIDADEFAIIAGLNPLTGIND